MVRPEFGDPIELDHHSDESGQLTVCDPLKLLGMETKRIYFLHNLREGARRGGHAHLELHQLIVSVSGSFELHLTRGGQTKSLRVDNPNVAFYVPPLTWRELDNFSADAICLVIASEHFLESDYIRDKSVFEKFAVEA